MSNGIEQIDGWEVAKVAWGVLMSFFAWLSVRSINRLEALEKTAVTRDEIKDHFHEIREERQIMRGEMNESLHRIETKLDETEGVGIIATRLARVEADITDLRQWKKLIINSYMGAVDELRERIDRRDPP